MKKKSISLRTRGALLALACAAALCAGALCGCASQTGQDAGSGAGDAVQEPSQVSVEGGQPTEDAEAFGSDATAGVALSADSNATEGESVMVAAIQVSVNGTTLMAQLEDSISSREFVRLLEGGPLTVAMHDYAGMEKVGSLPCSLTRSDKPTDVGPGDIVLYQGNQITVYYGTNSWNFTRLGSIQGTSAAELRDVLGAGDAEVTFSLAD